MYEFYFGYIVGGIEIIITMFLSYEFAFIITKYVKLKNEKKIKN